MVINLQYFFLGIPLIRPGSVYLQTCRRRGACGHAHLTPTLFYPYPGGGSDLAVGSKGEGCSHLLLYWNCAHVQTKRRTQRLADHSNLSNTKSVKALWSVTNTSRSTQKPNRRTAWFPALALLLRSQPLTPINQVNSRLSSWPDLKSNFAFDAVPPRT